MMSDSLLSPSETAAAVLVGWGISFIIFVLMMMRFHLARTALQSSAHQFIKGKNKNKLLSNHLNQKLSSHLKNRPSVRPSDKTVDLLLI
jgi:hypothetical protein